MRYIKNLRIDGNNVYSYGTHVATINHAERTLLIHGWWSKTTSKHVNHVADVYGLTKIEGKKVEEKDDSSSLLKSVAMVAAYGDILCNTQEEKNTWKKRMLKAGLENKGLSFPENFDILPEAEKENRLDGALNILREV